jgi:hypothetical protein
MLLSLLFVPLPLTFYCFFIKQRANAHTAGFRAKMTTQCVGTCEAAAATPLLASGQGAFADKLLFPRMQTFVTFAIMLACERFAADGAHEGPLVGVGA